MWEYQTVRVVSLVNGNTVQLEHFQFNRRPAIDKVTAAKSDVFSRECGGAS
jgi:hypothetical protein